MIFVSGVFPPRDGASPFPLLSFCLRLLSVVLTAAQLVSLRPDVALHQPGHPHLHRMLGDPQGAGRPLFQDPVAHSGCTQHLRALGKLPASFAESPHATCFSLNIFFKFHVTVCDLTRFIDFSLETSLEVFKRVKTKGEDTRE